MRNEDFNHLLTAMRPRLHRFCARIAGSTIDGEDVVQEVLVKAIAARPSTVIEHPERWLFRIAHNTALDFLRRRGRMAAAQSDEVLARVAATETEEPDPAVIGASFRTFLRLPALQRSAVVLKDVLGHSVDEIAEIVECSVPSVKSALQRGRSRVKVLAANRDDFLVPLLSDEDRARLLKYVESFRSGDFDSIRDMLAGDVKLDLVNRLQLEGRDRVDLYLTRYAQETKWRFALGAIEGQPTMLVFDSTGPMDRPAHFVLIDWSASRIISIRDFLFASYTLDGAEWIRLC